MLVHRSGWLRVCATGVLGAALAGCGADAPTGGGGSDSGTDSGSMGTDAVAMDVAVDAGTPLVDAGPQVDSGCPPPQRITPMQVPSGFLATRTVTLQGTIDGDTAHFSWPVTGRITMRFLWVNTEESMGADTTAFGRTTSTAVGEMLRAAREIVVDQQEHATRPGQPRLDQFGRSLAIIFVDGDLFQTRLVREGWSAYYTDFGCAPEPIHSVLLNAEAEARAAGRGIWRAGHPTDYAAVFAQWIPQRNACRPNPFRNQPYCR
jgi:micrococcal nuclease